jgi:hypothetical protein
MEFWMAKVSAGTVPEIRFRPTPEVYAKASRVAETLGLTLTDLARIGLTQLVNAREIRLVPPQSLRDLPIYGATFGDLDDIAAAAGRSAHDSHAQAGRLEVREPRPARKR